MRVPSTVAPGDARANMTLLNAALRVCGPMSERALCVTLLTLQVSRLTALLFFPFLSVLFSFFSIFCCC